jgi:lipopolysaccharide/colanic/teichoic acid biosynthesis glycosyltransferase
LKKAYKTIIKPILDVLAASVILVIISPIFLVVMLLLYIANQGKPFFLQLRPGKNEALFKIIKFKTMNDRADEHGVLLPDAERLTRIGNFVRKTSLDEIPQLINVIKGDMSLVGPRPFLPIYLPYYTDDEKKRHWVKPGITGYAQVNGRNYLEWDQKLKFDVYYVNNMSFTLDIKILFKTAYKVLGSKDVSVDPSKIQPPLHLVRGKTNT